MDLGQLIASPVLLGAMLVCLAWLHASCVSLDHIRVKMELKAASNARTALSRMFSGPLIEIHA
jgi:hypothetical protein